MDAGGSPGVAMRDTSASLHGAPSRALDHPETMPVGMRSRYQGVPFVV
jgi:hypothetical protein